MVHPLFGILRDQQQLLLACHHGCTVTTESFRDSGCIEIHRKLSQLLVPLSVLSGAQHSSGCAYPHLQVADLASMSVLIHANYTTRVFPFAHPFSIVRDCSRKMGPRRGDAGGECTAAGLPRIPGSMGNSSPDAKVVTRRGKVHSKRTVFTQNLYHFHSTADALQPVLERSCFGVVSCRAQGIQDTSSCRHQSSDIALRCRCKGLITVQNSFERPRLHRALELSGCCAATHLEPLPCSELLRLSVELRPCPPTRPPASLPSVRTRHQLVQITAALYVL